MHTIAFMPHELPVHAPAIGANFLRSHKYNSYDRVLLPHLLLVCLYIILLTLFGVLFYFPLFFFLCFLFFIFLFFFFFTKWLPFMTLSCHLRHLIALCIKTCVAVWKMSHNCIAVWYPSLIKHVGF